MTLATTGGCWPSSPTSTAAPTASPR